MYGRDQDESLLIKAMEKKANNIIFIAKRDSKGKFVDSDPPAQITDGRDTFKLPSAKDQLTGFYHENASQIVRAFPKLYKPLKPKGAK